MKAISSSLKFMRESLELFEAVAHLPLVGSFNTSVAAYTVPITLGIIVAAIPVAKTRLCSA